MRLLVVGHPFIIAYNQKKYVAMKRIEPTLRLRIVGPKQVRHPFSTYSCEVHPELSPDEVIPLASVFSRSHMTYLLDPLRMARILREFRPDVIHVEEEPHAGITVATLALRGAFLSEAATTLFTWDNLHRPRRFPLGLLKRTLRSFSLRQAATVVCGSREAEVLLRSDARYSGHTVVLPQFGVDPEEHIPGRELRLKEQLGLVGGLVVGYVGRLVPEKGIRLLLGALARLTHHPWKLLLVGSGPLENELHGQWIKRFPGRIVHVPAVPHQEVPRYLRCLDIFVLASYAVPNWKEQFGLTLAQAMMLGIPSVGSSSGTIPEVAGPGGVIFEEGDEKGLREALESLLQSPGRRTELGALAREFALKRYTISGVAAEYLAVFEQARRLQASSGREATVQAAVAQAPRANHP